MKHSDFRIGSEFTTLAGLWRCTDVGTRVITAIKISGAHLVARYQAGVTTYLEEPVDDWLNGPPYGVAEHVFDEYDQEGCDPA